MQLLIIWFFFSDAASLFKGSLPAMNVALVLLLFAFIKRYGAGPQLSRRAAANADVMSVHGHTAASPPRPWGAQTGFYTRPCWLGLSAWPFSKACFPSLPVLLSCTSLTSSRRWTCLPRMDNRTSIFFTEFGKRWPPLFCLFPPALSVSCVVFLAPFSGSTRSGQDWRCPLGCLTGSSWQLTTIQVTTDVYADVTCSPWPSPFLWGCSST